MFLTGWLPAVGIPRFVHGSDQLLPLATVVANQGGNARAGTRTRVQALATPGDNHYTTLAEQASQRRTLFD